MQATLFRWLEQLVGTFGGNRQEQSTAESEGIDILEQAEQARREWQNAQRYFECVSDPELVDHAILLRDAAQKKYMYLLRLARSEGLRAFDPEEATETIASPELVMPETGPLPGTGC
ncbi:MAG: YaaL family protein [Bacillota bacterium]